MNLKKIVLEIFIIIVFIIISIDKTQDNFEIEKFTNISLADNQFLKIFISSKKKNNNIVFVDINKKNLNLSYLLKDRKNFLIFCAPKKKYMEILKMYSNVEEYFIAYNLNIKCIIMNNLGNYKIILTNNIMLKIGRKDIKKRLDMFFIIYPFLKKINFKSIEYIDLRYKNAFAVRWF